MPLNNFLKQQMSYPLLQWAIASKRSVRKCDQFVRALFRAPIRIKKTRFPIPILAELATDTDLRVEEFWMARLLTKLSLAQDAVILDVSANIRQTMLSIKSVYPNAIYFGFEPNPPYVFFVQKLIKINGLDGLDKMESFLHTSVARVESTQTRDYFLVPNHRVPEINKTFG